MILAMRHILNVLLLSFQHSLIQVGVITFLAPALPTRPSPQFTRVTLPTPPDSHGFVNDTAHLVIDTSDPNYTQTTITPVTDSAIIHPPHKTPTPSTLRHPLKSHSTTQDSPIAIFNFEPRLMYLAQLKKLQVEDLRIQERKQGRRLWLQEREEQRQQRMQELDEDLQQWIMDREEQRKQRLQDREEDRQQWLEDREEVFFSNVVTFLNSIFTVPLAVAAFIFYRRHQERDAQFQSLQSRFEAHARMVEQGSPRDSRPLPLLAPPSISNAFNDHDPAQLGDCSATLPTTPRSLASSLELSTFQNTAMQTFPLVPETASPEKALAAVSCPNICVDREQWVAGDSQAAEFFAQLEYVIQVLRMNTLLTRSISGLDDLD